MLKHPTDRIERLHSILPECWSIHSSSKWTRENPARGQCSVTALVIQDIFGGEIYKTPTSEGWHFYNKINEQYYDLTASQFSKEIEYLHVPSSRQEAFSDTNEKQYSYLRKCVARCFRRDL